MNTREIAAELRLSHWSGIMRERRASGLSIRAYCAESGIHENVYHYWQRKLREAACQEMSVQTEEKALVPQTQPVVVSSAKPIPTGWSKCEITSPEKQSVSAIAIEIKGCRVLAEKDTDAELLKTVCSALLSL